MGLEIVLAGEAEHLREQVGGFGLEHRLNGQAFLALDHHRVQPRGIHQAMLVEGGVPAGDAINPVAGAEASSALRDALNDVTI